MKFASYFFCMVGGLFAIFGGVYLLGLEAASGSDNLFTAIAHGIGFYCVGKGIFMIAILFKPATQHINP
jgi:hypothetical protein